MKKNILVTALVTIVIGACTIFISDGLTYLVASLMALIIIGVIRANRSRVMKMTRWAKTNPGKAQGLIVGLQLTLMGLGLIAGYNLKELGFEFSNATAYIFTAIMVIGFLSVPFMPKRNTIAIPKEVNKQRLSFLSIALSLLIMMAFVGNRIGDVYPDSPITHALETIDQSIFPEEIIEETYFNEAPIGQLQNKNYDQYLADKLPADAVFIVNPIYDKERMDKSISPNNITSHKKLKKAAKAKKKELRKAKRKLRKEFRKKLRLAAGGGMCALGILFTIILIIPLCAGFCLIIGAFGTAGATSVLGGVALLAGSIWGMVESIKLCMNND